MKTLRNFALAAALSVVSGVATAAIVTIDGDNVRFTYDDATLYGSAFVIGDSIFFSPTNFRAESLNGAGAVSASATLNIGIEALTENFLITDVALAEQGDYFLSAGDTSVSASGRLQVTSQTITCGIFACSDSETFNVPGLTNVGATTDWIAAADVDFAATAGWGADTNVIAQIQNNLSATTLNVGEEAWIQKKAQFVGITATVIPVPAAVWLFMSALGAIGLLRKKTV